MTCLVVLTFQNCNSVYFSSPPGNSPVSSPQNSTLLPADDLVVSDPNPSVPAVYKSLNREINFDLSPKGNMIGAWGSFANGTIGTSAYCLDPIYNQT